MGFYTKTYLRNLSLNERKGTRTFSSTLNENKNLTHFDIFLSHSYKDKEYIKGLFIELSDMGFSVYVDWIIDPHLERNNVTKDTVNRIRRRMKQSKSLIYATSENASGSKWMPWELGFMDGETGRCSILPITNYESSSFSGQEFLSAYPYITKNSIRDMPQKQALWVNDNSSRYILMESWLEGRNPIIH